MKKYFLYTLMSVFYVLGAFSVYASNFVNLQSDEESYEVGEKALLTAHVKIGPMNPNYELYFKSSFGGANLAIDRITENEAVSFTPEFTEAGTFEWSVRVYMQDKNVAKALELSKANARAENERINSSLSHETDPEIREMLLEMRNRNNVIISKINAEMAANRRHLQTVILDVVVEEMDKCNKNESNSPIVLFNVKLDRPNYTYAVGERANFVVTRFVDFDGNEKFEYVVRAKFENWTVSTLETDNDYVTSGQTFVFEPEHVGEKTLKVSLYIRKAVKAQNLRDGIAKAEKSRADYIILRNSYPHDPLRYEYYDLRVKRMSEVISNYYDALEEMLSFVTMEETVMFVQE